MRANKFKLGDKVTCRHSEDAYYSGYAGRPIQNFTPGMIGIVAAVDVPCVYYRGHTSFYCVDFIGDNGEVWRTSLNPDNIKLVK
jgi:hypothetical protein